MNCFRGPRYRDVMDAKIAHAEALRNGRRTEGYYLCSRCGGYHLGLPRKQHKVEKCWATAKVCHSDKQSALRMLDRLQAKGREEVSTYQCKHCQQWHLTSLKEGEYATS